MGPRLVNITTSIVPISSTKITNQLEARRRVIGLYRAWYRQIPVLFYEYNIPISPEEGRSKLREIFVKNSKVKDFGVITSLVMKGQMELNESSLKQKEECHLWKYFRDDRKPKDFLTKFLEGK